MAQLWSDLLFAHWPVPPAALRDLIPPRLTLETFDGEAWVGVVPFRMSKVRLRFSPAAPWLSAFPELNVRTYVSDGERPGVWFFSLDAGNPVAVAVARRWFHLPYFRARMSVGPGPPAGGIAYRSVRTHQGAPPAVFRAGYHPTGSPFAAAPGSLEHWLVERYCLYADTPRGQLLRGEIDHPRWALHVAEAEIEMNTMAAAAGIVLPDRPPLLHFARRQAMVAWAPRPVAR
jgi:uncharacterized protein YqjF (DUF2071 family)